MRRQASSFSVILLFGLLRAAGGQAPAEVVPVEPADLGHREDLIGREVIVDDHVAFYVIKRGAEDDELRLKRTEVNFLVPRRLRPPAPNRMTAVLVRGELRKESARVIFRVTGLKVVSNDLERLDAGVRDLPPKDYETRKLWARWAERRAADFKDDALMKRAKAIEGEALRLETEVRRLAVDAPREWLAMAQDARRRQVPEPGPSALAHRALRAGMAAAGDVAELKAVVQQIESFFPAASADRDVARINLARWEAPYANDPEGTYRTAPPQVRKALDRRLWADATERLMELQASRDLQAAVPFSEQAATILPEKLDLPGRLLQKPVDSARQNLAALRLGDVKELARIYREKLRRSDEATAVLRDWLKIRQDRLSDTDAEGPLSLANLYEELLQDRVTSVELLRKAWKIDPTSKEIVEAFRSRGFRRVKDDWVETTGGTAANALDVGKPGEPTSAASQGLRGLTPEEVRLRIGGRPNRISYVGSRGQVIEQWIYYLDTKNVRYVNLLHAPGEMRPRVIADYTLPRTTVKGGTGSPR